MEIREREVEDYVGRAGDLFGNWRQGITDIKVRAAVDARIARLRAGNTGKARSVGGGVSESKIDLGPGYRIYYGIDGERIIMLCGGDKSSQSADIDLAKRLWAEYEASK